jgi:hypothetical protein
MGKFDSTCRAPPRVFRRRLCRSPAPDAAAQVALKKANFKTETGFSLDRCKG